MIRRYSLALLLGMLMTIGSMIANAQDETTPAADPAAPPAEAAPTDAAAPPQAPAPLLSATPEEELKMPRFRWGISGAGGPLIGGVRGGAGTLTLRLGAQILEMLGVYAQPILLAGAGAAADNDSAAVQGLALYGVGVLAEVDLINLIFIGLGPEIMWGGIAEASSSATSSSASGSVGPFFALAARIGVALGSKTPKRRSCFTIGIDMQLVIHNGNATFMPMLALGYDRF